jgi:hypothetical protein
MCGKACPKSIQILPRDLAYANFVKNVQQRITSNKT